MENNRVISILSNLTEIAKDGEKGFELAAQKEQNAEHKDLFRLYSEQRARIVQDLKEHVRDLGGDPDNSGTVLGSAHRGWIQTKSAATGNDTAAIVAECERGEDAAKHAYEDALKEDLPSDVRSFLQEQYEDVKEAHDRIRELEIQYKGK